ncbi:hypothetical protein L5515_001302 [Caenorhabditis briggsae]|uniref:Innexin n=1 Tax=Caenorhabditis briggsae TaxID=6238 RepID=A0AAE9J3I4_CAEBR|nr:hypothetical protein L3Y34_015227 [Caenorhabditis briggsae]UMM12610.1 hypothetical protein L5515_001302 [Caenorhabditis briggsae]
MTKDAVISFTNPLRRLPGLQGATEKLLHNTTISILIFLFFLLASKPLFGTPISCQLPKEWPESSIQYFADFCYYAKRDKVSFATRSIGSQGTISHNKLTGTSDFYMWVPLVPILHGILTLLPVFFWKFVGLDSFNGSDIIAFIEYYSSKNNEKSKEEGRLVYPEEWRFMKQAAQFQEWIKLRKGAWYGPSQTMCVYVGMKWFRFVIFLLQFWMIASFFGGGKLSWGFDDLRHIIEGRFKNSLEGQFTLISGCRVTRLSMGIDPAIDFRKGSSNVNSVLARCVLSANYVNAKAFLFLYWWFLFVSLISVISAVYYTTILLIPRYRKYTIQTMIRHEDYFIETYGGPHPDLNLNGTAPLDYLIHNLGNDGFLVFQMIYDVSHFGCYRFAEHIWMYSIVNNGEIPVPQLQNDEKVREKEKKDSPVRDTEMDGAGDRYRGGKDHPKNKKSSSSPNLSVVSEEDDSNSTKISLSGESQPSLLITESDEEPLLDPSLLNVLTT